MTYSVEIEDFESIEVDWEKLLPSCPANTMFITSWWQKLWWQHFGDGAKLHIVSVRDDDGIVGIAPLMFKDDVLSFLGDTDLFDYHDFLVPIGRETEFYNVLCEHIVGLEWNTLELKSLRESSPTLKFIAALAGDKGFTVDVSQEDVSPQTELPASWDEYLSSLRKKDRHELRRKLRRLDAAEDFKQYVCADPETLGACMDDFFRLLRASSPDKDEFLIPEREQFFRELSDMLAKRDEFRLYMMEVEGKRVAACICFDYDGKYLLYNSGYDLDYSALSVGLLNKALSMQDAIEEGKSTFDFLRGNERYKYNLGGVDQQVFQLVVRR